MKTPSDQPAHRVCGTCTLCCDLPEIETFSKPPNQLCVHGEHRGGCRIYADRPALCRAFLCSWMTSPQMNDLWQPAACHMLVYQQGPQITVLVDPRHPVVWKDEPYFSQLEEWAADVEPRGGFVIVFVGDEVTKIVPGQALQGRPAAKPSFWEIPALGPAAAGSFSS